MTEMYVKFTAIPKGIGKKVKIKKRKKYTLLETEDILQRIAQDEGRLQLSFEIHFGKQVYDFSNLTITTQFQSLDELLMNDIYHSASMLRKADMSSEEAAALEAVAEEIQLQYEKAVEMQGVSESAGPIIGKRGSVDQQDPGLTTSYPKQPPVNNGLNIGFLGKGKGINLSEESKEAPVVAGNTEKFEKPQVTNSSITSMEQASSPSESQFEPIESIDSFHSGTHVPQSMSAPVSIEKQPVQSPRNQKGQINKKQQNQMLVNQPLNQMLVNQPLTIVEYMDFSKLQEDEAIATTIRELETSNQNEQETLMDLLGIDKKNISSLDQKKLHFACELMRKDFLLSLKSSFLANISELKSLTATKLEEAFHTNRLDYESFDQDISELVTEEQKRLIERTEHARQQLDQQLTSENTKEQELLTAKQQAELETLKLQHKEIQEKRTTEATHRKKERLANFLQEERQKNAQQLKISEQSLKDTELKKRKEKALAEKQKILATCGKGIMGTIEQLDYKKDLYYKDLLESVQEMEPEFKKELEQEQRLILKNRELSAMEEKNRLTEEQLRMEQDQWKKEQESVGSQNQVAQQLQELLLMQQQQSLMGTLNSTNNPQAEEIADLKETIRQLSEKINTPAPVQQTVENVFPKKSLFKALGLGICGLVLGGLISFMIFSGGRSNAALQGTTTTDSVVSTTATESLVSASKETENSLDQAATKSSVSKEVPVEKIEVKEAATAPKAPVLEKLLSGKKYQEAAENFPDRLEDIEQRLYVERELDELTAFNLTYKTRFGQLDEAALRTDVWKVVEQYNQMSACLIDLLSYKQKEDISLSLLKVGRIYEAQQLLE